MTTRDVLSEVWTMADQATREYYANREAGSVGFYLYHQPGTLRFFPDGALPAASWTLADPQIYRGSHDRRVLTAKVVNLAMRLPILLPD